MNRHLDYIVPDTDTTSVSKPQTPEPDDGVRERFAALMTETFDAKGRLRAEHRPKPKAAKKPPSLFTIDMLGNDGALPPYIA